MQLATYEITIEQPSFGQKVGQCSSGEAWRYNGLSAPRRCNEIVVNFNRQLFSSYAQCLSFLNSTSLPQPAIFAIVFLPEGLCDVTIRRWRTPTDYENVNEKRPTSDTYQVNLGCQHWPLNTHMKKSHNAISISVLCTTKHIGPCETSEIQIEANRLSREILIQQPCRETGCARELEW